MRFLIDECTGPALAKWLRSQNHDVSSIYEEDRGLDDDSILEKANSENRILITNDKDFGELIFREQKLHKGIILLRLDDERATNKISILKKLFMHYSNKLANNFVVVTETTIRIIELKKSS